MRTGPTNPILVELIQELKRESLTGKTALWKRIAADLERPTRIRRVVNLSTINRITKDNEIVVVPGKVLGAGALDHKVTVGAFAFSESARSAIETAKGKCLSIPEMMKLQPDGKSVRILG